MPSLSLDDPAWQASVPHLVAPYNDEWLMGLLLRCDEANGWGSKTSLAHALRPGPEKFHRCWYKETTPNLIVIPHSSLNLDYLAQLLALPRSSLLATTYQIELSRLYGFAHLDPRSITPSFSFHLCPVCVAQTRLLSRSLTLPHITHCPRHQVILQKECQCGTSLRLFHRKALPFTCHSCGMNWAELPQIKVSSERMVLEQKLLSWYELFFSEKTYVYFYPMHQLLNAAYSKKRRKNTLLPEKYDTPLYRSRWISVTLSTHVAQLINYDISPEEVIAYCSSLKKHVHPLGT